jgi:pimeloyl-ACP methyl ester carboxylesterase
MGGYIAFSFYRRHRERLCGLVLANTRATPDAPAAAENRLAQANEVLASGCRTLAEAMEGKLFSPAAKEKRPDLVATIRKTMEAAPPGGVAAALRGMAARIDSTPDLRSIDIPTLVVAGGDDAVVGPTEMEGMARAIPGASFVVVPAAGHLSPAEEPTAFNQALADFLARI